jgi:WD40 repeat protein
MQAGIRDVTVRAGGAVREATGTDWMTVLCAGALAPVVAAEPGSGPVVAVGVGAVAGTNLKVLSNVISSAVDQARPKDRDEDTPPDDVEPELAAGIEAVLADDSEAATLREEIAILFRETDAARQAVAAAADAEDEDLRSAVVAAFEKLADDFPEFRFLAADVGDPAAGPSTEETAEPAAPPDPAAKPGTPRIRRTVVVGLATVVVVALASTGLAVRASVIASEQRNVALSRQLAAESQALATTDPARSQLLAAAAWQVAPSPQARAGMLKALANSARRATVGSAVAFSADGKVLATGGGSGVVRLWDTAKAETVDTFDAKGPVYAVAFGREGVLAGGTGDDGAWLWSSATGEQIRLRSGLPKITTMTFSPDGAKLAAAGDRGQVQLWDAAKGRSIKAWGSHGGHIQVLALSAKDILATGDRNGKVALRNTRTGKGRLIPSRRDFGGRSGQDVRGVTALAFSPDGKILADGGPDGIVRLWNTGNGRSIASFPGSRGKVSALAFSPNGAVLAVAGPDGTVGLWDTATLTPVVTLPDRAEVSVLVFSPDGTRLASGGNVSKLWDNPIGKRVLVSESRTLLDVAQPGRRDLVLSADGSTVGRAEEFGVRAWNAGSRETMLVKDESGTTLQPPLALNPDGSSLAAGGGGAGVRLFDTVSGKQIRTITGPSELGTLAFGPDGLLAGGGIQGRVWLWNSASGRKLRALRGGDTGVAALAFSPDGTVVAAANLSGAVSLWYTSTGNWIGEVDGVGFGESVLAFSPDGTVLAQSTPDGEVRLLDVASGEEITRLRGHVGEVHAVVFGPGGNTVVTSGTDGTVRLWEATNGEPVMDLSGQTGAALALAFRDDGALVAVGADNFLVSWNLSYLEDPYQELCDRAGRALTRAEWKRHLPDMAYQEVCPQG